MQSSFAQSCGALVTTVLALSAHLVFADADSYYLEEVVVTAQKREQNIQDVPISVAAFSGDFVKRQGIADLDDFSSFVPNLEIFQSTDVRIRIRGLGSGTNKGFEQSVGMYVDGVYLARDRYFRGPLFDLERIEVLRGPQGVLFGKNAIAGAVNITTAQPAPETETAIMLRAGEDDLREIRAAVSGPVYDTLYGRLAVIGRQEEGYVENNLGGKDGPEIDDQAVRFSLQWAPSDIGVVTLKLERGDYDTDGHPVQVSDFGPYEELLSAYDPAIEEQVNKRGSYDTTYGPHEFSTDTRNATLNIEYSLGGLTLTSVTGYVDYDAEDNLAVDFMPVPLANQWRNEEHEQYSQELRIASAGGETLDYVGGVYYQHSTLDYSAQTLVDLNSLLGFDTPFSLPFGSIFDTAYDQESDVWAVFAELTWNMTHALSLSAGVRYTDESKEIDAWNDVLALDGSPADELTQTVFQTFAINYTFDDDRSEDDVDPLVRIQYYPVEWLMTYLSASSGSKGGGYNMTVGNPDIQPIDYDGEDATTIEAGLKTTLLESRASLNVAVYHTEFDDLQVSTYDGVAGYIVGNAAEATAQGVEIDGTWRIAPNLTLAAGYAYLDAEYDSYETAPCTVVQQENGCTAQDLSGERLPFAAEHSASLRAEFLYPLTSHYELRASTVINYTDDVYLQGDADPKDVQDAYTELDARISLASSVHNWELAIVGRNLTDEKSSGTSFDMPVLAGDAHVADLRPPRRLAAELSIRW